MKHHALSDGALVGGCLCDQAEAWRHLFERFQPLLVQIASRELARCQIKDRSSAEDVVSELWSALVKSPYRKLRAFNATKPMEGYLIILLRSQVRQWCRRQRIQSRCRCVIFVPEICTPGRSELVSLPFLQEEVLALLTAHERDYVERYELRTARRQEGQPMAPTTVYKLRQRTRAKVQRVVDCY